MALEAAKLEHSVPQSGLQPVAPQPLGVSLSGHPVLLSQSFIAPPPSGTDAAAAYQKHAKPSAAPAPMSDVQKYKDDQLLRNPGGRNYYLDEKKVVEPSHKQSILGWSVRIFPTLSEISRIFSATCSWGPPFFTGTRKMKSCKDNRRDYFER